MNHSDRGLVPLPVYYSVLSLPLQWILLLWVSLGNRKEGKKAIPIPNIPKAHDRGNRSELQEPAPIEKKAAWCRQLRRWISLPIDTQPILPEALLEFQVIAVRWESTSLARREEDDPKHMNTPSRKAKAKRGKRNWTLHVSILRMSSPNLKTE